MLFVLAIPAGIILIRLAMISFKQVSHPIYHLREWRNIAIIHFSVICLFLGFTVYLAIMQSQINGYLARTSNIHEALDQIGKPDP
jgi:hypothetical protein